MARGEGKSTLYDLASTMCLLGAVFLYFFCHQVVLAVLAVVASFMLSRFSGRALKDGRIDEALEAKAAYDRLHPEEAASEEERSTDPRDR